MFTYATVTIPGTAPIRFDLAGTGPLTIALPSGSGKTTAIEGLARILTGEPGPDVEAATAKGVYRVGPKLRTITRGEALAKYGSAADYRAALPPAFRDPRLTTLIMLPSWWQEQYRGGVAGIRALTDALLLSLPAGSVLDIIREDMGDDWREEDPADVKGALAAQTAANKAAATAGGAATSAADALTRARAALAACAEVDVTADRATVKAGGDWQRYDTAAAAWIAYDDAVTSWTARKPGEAPAYSAEAHDTIRGNVARLEAQLRQEEAGAAAEVACVKAEAKAEADRIEAARQAEVARVDAERKAAEAQARAVEEARKPQLEPAQPAPPPTRESNPFTIPAPAPSLFATPTTKPCPACSGTGRITA